MGLFYTIKNLMFNITNFLIGYTAVFIVIFGWFLVITGLIFLSQPEKARTKLVRQGFVMAKNILILVLMYLVVMALSIFGRLPSPFGGILSLAAVIAAVWTFFSLSSRSLKIITDKLALLSVAQLRGYALAQIVVGALMITLQKRIW